MELRYTSDEAAEHPYLSGKPFTLSWRKRQTKKKGKPNEQRTGLGGSGQ
jgi:hypothetical protein